MSAIVPILKDEDTQRLIPSAWRATFSAIVNAFKEEDFTLQRGIAGVRAISEKNAAKIADNIESYEAKLIGLPEQTWETSVCQWMQEFWDVLIDLYTVKEGASDLVLAARVYETGSTYIFEVQSIYVP